LKLASSSGSELVAMPPPESVPPFEATLVDEAVTTRVQHIVQGSFHGVTVVAGKPGSSKSAMMVDVGGHIAAGVPWFGRKVRKGPVLYVAAEAPATIIERWRATKRAKFTAGRLPFYIVKEAPGLGSEISGDYDLARLLSTAKEIARTEGQNLALLVLDTVAACLGGGRENEEGMLRLTTAALALQQQTGATIVLLHHPAKNDDTGLRGHGSLGGAADLIINIAADSVTGVRTATVTKNRNGPVGAEIFYKLETIQQPEPDEFGDPVTTVIVRPADDDTLAPVRAARAAKVMGKNQSIALTALKEWKRTHATTIVISSDDLRGLLDGCGINNRRRPEVITSLVTIGVLTPAVGGHTVNQGALS
jgi:hypothetical protein